MSDFRKNDHIFKIASREISIMRMIDYPNIVKLYEIYEDERHLCLVLEYCSGGDLMDYLCEHHHLVEAEAARFMHEILKTVEYLHNQRISHRDLKLQNFMLDKKSPDAVLKLIDFGLSARCFSEEDKFKTIVGSPLYIAPEIIEKKPYDVACDLWSLGVILYLLLAGEPPFRGDSPHEIFENISEGVFEIEKGIWKNISPDAKNLVKSLLKTNPKERISVKKAIEHVWFSKKLNNAHFDDCPLKTCKTRSLTVYKEQPPLTVFKTFDKDTNSRSFSMENASDINSVGSKDGKVKEHVKTISNFGKTSHEELEIGEENAKINLEHIA